MNPSDGTGTVKVIPVKIHRWTVSIDSDLGKPVDTQLGWKFDISDLSTIEDGAPVSER